MCVIYEAILNNKDYYCNHYSSKSGFRSLEAILKTRFMLCIHKTMQLLKKQYEDYEE